MRHLLLFVLALNSAAVAAATVYKSVAPNGTVVFSDTAPAADVASEVIEVQAPKAQSPGESWQQLERMRKSTDRMAADRREREQARAESRAHALEQERLAWEQAQPPATSPETGYILPYPAYAPVTSWQHRPGRRPSLMHSKGAYGYHYGGRSKTSQRPPLRAQTQGRLMESSNAQLMRPIVSGRR